MNLKNISNETLENQLKDLIFRERKLLHLILLHIREVDCRRFYLSQAYPSLFEYLTKKFGYSAAAAQRRIEASRLLKDIPELAEKIQSGVVTLTQVGELTKAIKQKERESEQKISIDFKKDLLFKIGNKTSMETQKLLAQELDLNLKPLEQKQIQKDESVHLQITLSKEQYEKLLRCRDLGSHALLQRNGLALSNVIEMLSDQFISRKLGKLTSAPEVKVG